jgi:hypothetical protein
MSLVTRHVASTLVVLAALIAVALVFAFARPEAHAAQTSHEVKMTHEHRYALRDVRQAFADQKIALVRAQSPGGGTQSFLDRHPGDSFQVTVFAPTATVSFATGRAGTDVYEKRLGTLEVFYGGHDKHFLARMVAAVAALDR